MKTITDELKRAIEKRGFRRRKGESEGCGIIIGAILFVVIIGAMCGGAFGLPELGAFIAWCLACIAIFAAIVVFIRLFS